MKVTFTQPAIDQLHLSLPRESSRLKLFYDTEGCGCAVSGVPALLVIDAMEESERQAESHPFELWYEPRHEVFFEEELKVDYNSQRNAYILKSDNQTYTSNLRLVK